MHRTWIRATTQMGMKQAVKFTFPGERVNTRMPMINRTYYSAIVSHVVGTFIARTVRMASKCRLIAAA